MGELALVWFRSIPKATTTSVTAAKRLIEPAKKVTAIVGPHSSGSRLVILDVNSGPNSQWYAMERPSSRRPRERTKMGVQHSPLPDATLIGAEVASVQIQGLTKIGATQPR